MPYKIFISTNDDQACRHHLQTVTLALWGLDHFPVASLTVGDDPTERLMMARQFIEGADVLIGLYDATYGDIPPGETQSYAELEYHAAMAQGLRCLIFMPQTARTTDDERMRAFVHHLERRHILHFFEDDDDLKAQVVAAINTFKHTRRSLPPAHRYKGGGPWTSLVPPAAPPTLPQPLALEQLVENALSHAEDDIESIVRRALELHEAQRRVNRQKPDGLMQINPIFGPPLTQSQFNADVFMIMPFRDELDGIYRDVVRPVVEALNMTIKRGDEFSSVTGAIMKEVWAAINACKLVICETTVINANVYYELGIAHTLGKPAILLTQETEVEDLPFDIRHLRFIVYENSIAGGQRLESDLRQSVIWVMNDLEERQNRQQDDARPDA